MSEENPQVSQEESSPQEEEASPNQEVQGEEKEDGARPKTSASSTSKKSRSKSQNIKHRGPPSKTAEDIRKLEQGWILDANAVSSISNDYSKSNPKLGPAIPPYNSQKDYHVKTYFRMKQVDTTLNKTGQIDGGCSLDGQVIDRFIQSGAGYQYLSRRNAAGAGHSTSEVDGHAQFMQGIKPLFGWHGEFGYRRNTPPLRMYASPFGKDSRSPTH